MRKLTYEIIAEKAGVSISTVSRYFNSGYISEKNQDAISQVLETSGYIKTLWGKKDSEEKNIYFVAQSLRDNDLLEIIATIDNTTKIDSSQVVITSAHREVGEYIKELKKIMSSHPRALVLINPPRGNALSAYLETVKNATRIILFGVEINGFDSIHIDYESLIAQLCSNFQKLTEDDNVALVTDYRQTPTTIREQMLGFTNFCKQTRDGACVIKYFDNRVIKTVSEVIADLRRRKIRNIICTTHEVFQNMLVHNSDNFFNLSDIGYNTVHDYNNSYFIKQFIDYHSIWLHIENIISRNLPAQSIKIRGQLIRAVA